MYILKLIIFIGILDTERLCESVAEVMAGTGLQCFSVMHQCFYCISILSSCKFLMLCFSTCYKWYSHCLFVEVFVNLPHLDCSLFSLFICCMNRVAFLP